MSWADAAVPIVAEVIRSVGRSDLPTSTAGAALARSPLPPQGVIGKAAISGRIPGAN